MTIDPIVLALTQNRLDDISRRMGQVMLRTAHSPIFSQYHDFSNIITDAAGTLISQADGVPIQSGNGGFTVRALLEAFEPPQYGAMEIGSFRITASSPAGGGWGDPLEREPHLVLRDVRHGLVSRSVAHDVYGVVVNGTGRWLDAAGTAKLRMDLLQAPVVLAPTSP